MLVQDVWQRRNYFPRVRNAHLLRICENMIQAKRKAAFHAAEVIRRWKTKCIIQEGQYHADDQGNDLYGSVLL